MPSRIIPRRKSVASLEQYSCTGTRFLCISRSRRLKGSSVLPQTWGNQANHCLHPAIPAGLRWLSGFSITGVCLPIPLLPLPARAGPHHYHAKPHDLNSPGHKWMLSCQDIHVFLPWMTSCSLLKAAALQCWLTLLLVSPLPALWKSTLVKLLQLLLLPGCYMRKDADVRRGFQSLSLFSL